MPATVEVFALKWIGFRDQNTFIISETLTVTATDDRVSQTIMRTIIAIHTTSLLTDITALDTAATADTAAPDTDHAMTTGRLHAEAL